VSKKQPASGRDGAGAEFLQQVDKLPLFIAIQRVHHGFVKLSERLIDLGQSRQSRFRNRHKDDSTVIHGTIPADLTRLFQPINQSGDPRNDCNHPTGDLENRERLPFATQDSQNVVLRRSQPKRPKETIEVNLQLARTPHQIQPSLLRGRLEGLSLLEFGLELTGGLGHVRHSSQHGFHDISLHNIYLRVN
jgi:hypothetical protein